MRWAVTSQLRDRLTKKILPFGNGQLKRTEVVDAAKWGLKNPHGAEEIKMIYETFYNDLPTKQEPFIVEVLDVSPAKEK